MNRCTTAVRAACSVLALHAATPAAQAHEVFALGGGLEARPGKESTYTWQIEYRHRLAEYIDLTAAWMNEGHVTNHHRDGMAAQVWARTSRLHPSLELAAGIGPYFYFDTTNVAPNKPEIDAHGTGVIFSLAGTWKLEGPWRMQLRGNRVETRRSIDSTSVLLGIGYELDSQSAAAGRLFADFGRPRDSSLAVMLGAAIVNSFESENAFAKSIEYRQGIGRYFDWSVGWLNEGSRHLGRRNGLMSQLWVTRPILDNRATLEAGFGPLLVVDTYDDVGAERWAGILSLAASYQVAPRWSARVSWSRVFADRPFDSDVLLVGAAYKF